MPGAIGCVQADSTVRHSEGARGPRDLRVLYHYHSQQFDTGSPRVLATLIDSLDRRVYEPLFLANGDGPLIGELRRRNVAIVEQPTTVITYRHPIASLRALAAKRRLLRALKIDLVHVNDFGWNLDVVLAAALIGIPVVLHVHNPV